MFYHHLESKEILHAQHILSYSGAYQGPVDGIMGENTWKAIIFMTSAFDDEIPIVITNPRPDPPAKPTLDELISWFWWAEGWDREFDRFNRKLVNAFPPPMEGK